VRSVDYTYVHVHLLAVAWQLTHILKLKW